jgi:hypothetical protein
MAEPPPQRRANMRKTSRRFVRKFPAVTRQVELNDSLKLFANPALRDLEWMLESVVHDFAGLGYDADELSNLFRSPAYPVLNRLLDYFGRAEIRRRLDDILTRSCGARTLRC